MSKPNVSCRFTRHVLIPIHELFQLVADGFKKPGVPPEIMFGARYHIFVFMLQKNRARFLLGRAVGVMFYSQESERSARCSACSDPTKGRTIYLVTRA